MKIKSLSLKNSMLLLVAIALLTSCGSGSQTTEQTKDSTTAQVADSSSAQVAAKDYLKETKEEKDARMKWWKDARFGMFIHWGVYAMPAGEHKGQVLKQDQIGEWIMSSLKIPVAEYEEYSKQFNPTKFDAKEWVRIAKDAGMKYIVITSKHHDGFCLWDSKVSEYDIIDFAPYKKDILKALSDECKAQGVTLCFYHSIMDWHHPDAQAPHYPDYNTNQKKNPNFDKYVVNYMKPQLKELIANYDPAVLWFDGEWIPEWTEEQGKDLYNFVRSQKPSILINNRVGKGRNGMQGMNEYEDAAGDFGTPEQEILAGKSDVLPWESCMTMNDTWGFKKNDNKWKSAEMLVHNLADISAKGGNYLLNIGPKADGEIPTPTLERLAEMGKWLKVNGEAIYETKSLKEYKEGETIRYTQSADGKFVYAISLKWVGNALNIKNIVPKEGSEIKMLGLDTPLKWTYDANKGLNIQIPKELQAENKRPCKYAYTFKIEGAEKQ
jgi:alpha-L-fucosidase